MSKRINIVYDMTDMKLWNDGVLLGETKGYHDDVLNLLHRYCQKGLQWLDSPHREVRPIIDHGRKKALFVRLKWLCDVRKCSLNSLLFGEFIHNNIDKIERFGGLVSIDEKHDRIVYHISVDNSHILVCYYKRRGSNIRITPVDIDYYTKEDLTVSRRFTFLKSLINLK